nr:Chain D, Neurexin-1 [Homo sapiens]6NID_E Chain E, Neurexin-1 [Homo sapiens]6NID_F Chain F, Neurexin-1 [Homo sapiens]
KKNKDKEYYV